MTKIATVITTLGITCCLPSSNTCCHALSVPSTRLATSPLSTQSLKTTTTTTRSSYEFALFMAPQTPPQQPRQPRRMLKKRTTKEGDGRQRKRNRRNGHAETTAASSFGSTILPGIMSNNGNNNSDDNVAVNDGSNRKMFNNNNNRFAVTQEYRPLVPSVRRDMGEDYWIDPKDLERERQKEEHEQQRRRIAFGTKSDSNSDQAMSQEKLMTEVKAPYRQNWIGYFSLMVAVLSIIVSQFPELLEPTPTIRFPDL